MKKVLLLLVACVTLFSCSQSPQKKAEKMVKAYLKKTLDDPSSYKGDSFDQLDSLFFIYFYTDEAIELRKLGWYDAESDFFGGKYGLKATLFEIEARYAKTTKERQNFMDSVEVYKQKTLEIDKIYKENEAKYDEFVGWEVRHKYRAKNKVGALVLESKYFQFNKELTEVYDGQWEIPSTEKLLGRP